jgi:DNA damage-binding protein 1
MTPGAKAKLAGHNVTFLDADMNKIFTFDLEPLEQGISITACRFHDDDASKASKQFIIVGTAYVIPNEIEPSKGRILVFAIDSTDRGADACDANNASSAMDFTDASAHLPTIVLVSERPTKAAVFSLVAAGGRLVAGIGAKVLSHAYPSFSNTSFIFT